MVFFGTSDAKHNHEYDGKQVGLLKLITEARDRRFNQSNPIAGLISRRPTRDINPVCFIIFYFPPAQ